MTMTQTLLNTLTAQFAGVERISTESAIELIGILDGAPTEVLVLLCRRRVKFCWRVAFRVLRDRHIEAGGRQPGPEEPEEL